MRIENLFLNRMRSLPAEAETTGHRLALKGGYIYQTAAGIYTYSTIAWKALRNIEAVIRDELDRIGCQEILMPVLSPLSLWEETGRDKIDVLLKFKTHVGTEMTFNLSHEEVAVDYARTNIQSYRQFPFTLYQFQTKYRDELRPRAGLLRCREFLMKDAYSFHATEKSLDYVYGEMLKAYHRIYGRLGLKGVIDVEAPGGDMSDRNSHEFQWLSEAGEDSIYICDACGFKSNKEILTGGDKEASDVASCPVCGAALRKERGVEVGNIFRLSDKYTKPMKVSYTDEDGGNRIPVMGCYGIGVSRTLGCIFEQSGDESKAAFNPEVAPYKAHVISIGQSESARGEAERLYEGLIAAGIEVVIDATDDRAGSKFANADLLGAPIRAIISEKNLADGITEMKYSGIETDAPASMKTGQTLDGITRILKGRG
jgi:prolyl-tRNA synthetase